jgi:REP element-mobilizing transposase RayT
MSDKPKYNPNIHQRKSIRLKGYDYSQAGLYFITICCQDRICRFGKIENDIMILNDAGKIADECWLEIPQHFPNAMLHEHIVMPNHVHGIVELTNASNVEVQNFEPLQENNPITVGAENFLPLQQRHNEFQKMIPRSIGSIVKGFKIGVTVRAKDFLPQPHQKIWQRNYHEHIIRNEQSYQTISEYIMNNPAKWNDDKFYNSN